MTRKRNKYAGLTAVQKNDLYRMTPEQWKDHLQHLDYRTMRKLYRQMQRRGGPEWNRVKDFFVKVLIEKQNKLIATANDIKPNC